MPFLYDFEIVTGHEFYILRRSILYLCLCLYGYNILQQALKTSIFGIFWGKLPNIKNTSFKFSDILISWNLSVNSCKNSWVFHQFHNKWSIVSSVSPQKEHLGLSITWKRILFVTNILWFIHVWKNLSFEHYVNLKGARNILIPFTFSCWFRSFRGIYCFQHVHDSKIPSFHQYLRLCSVTLTAFVRFCSNLHHTLIIRQCMFDRKIGAEGSALQVMPLCNSNNKVFVLWLIVHTFWNWFLLYNFDSSWPILFKVTPHLTHQTMHIC